MFRKNLPYILLGIVLLPWMAAFPPLLLLLLPWVAVVSRRRLRAAAYERDVQRLSMAFQARHAAAPQPAPVRGELLVREMLHD